MCHIDLKFARFDGVVKMVLVLISYGCMLLLYYYFFYHYYCYKATTIFCYHYYCYNATSIFC